MVKQVLELKGAGASIRSIAKTLGISRNTVRKYLRAPGIPQAAARPPRVSKLAPYTEYVLARVDAGIDNCQVLLRELRERGYTGGYTILKELIHPLRPCPPVQGMVRFETDPGEQAQVDFGSCPYQGLDGRMCRIWAFTMVLSWSRMLSLECVRLADTATFVRCHPHACEYCGGVPRRCLYDRTTLVVLGRAADGALLWNEGFLACALRIGMDIQLCRGYRPQTKGRVESGITDGEGTVWPGIHQFTDDADLNRQGRTWCDTVANVRVHGITHERPIDRWPAEQATLHAVPTPDRLEVFFWDEHRVTRDGYVRWDGTSYGLPWSWRPGQAVQCTPRPRCEARRGSGSILNRRLASAATAWGGSIQKRRWVTFNPALTERIEGGTS